MLNLNHHNILSHINNNIYLLLFLIFTVIVITTIIYIYLAGSRGGSKLAEVIQTAAAALYIGTTLAGSGGDKDKDDSKKKESDKKDSKDSTQKDSDQHKEGDNNSKSGSSSPSKALSILSLFSMAPGSTTLNQYAFGIFLLSATAFSCSVNILLYFLTMYLINKNDYENKYPRLGWIIRRYKNTSTIYLIIEILLFYFSMLVIIISSIYASNL